MSTREERQMRNDDVRAANEWAAQHPPEVDDEPCPGSGMIAPSGPDADITLCPECDKEFQIPAGATIPDHVW